MALPAIFKLLIETAASDTILKSLKKAWAKSAWARDSNKVNEVERKIDELAHELGRLARNLTPGAVASEVDRRLVRFEKELVELGLPTDEAAELRQSVGVGLETTIIEPIAEGRRLQTRIETLEEENLEAAKRVASLEKLAERALEADKRATTAQFMAAVALAIGGIAVIATLLLAITRR